MTALPEYTMKTYRDGDELPAEAEELFARQLAEARSLPAEDPAGGVPYRFILVCAVADGRRILGGVHLDTGPVSGNGPLADVKLAYLERTLVRPEHRRQGVATALLRKAIDVARQAGCEYIRCSNNWDNPAETALFRKCGFALTDIGEDGAPEPCYFAVRPLQNLSP